VEKYGPKGFGNNAETPEFAGAAIQGLVSHPEVAMKKSGKILLTTELAEELGFTDVTGKIPNSHPRGLRQALESHVPSHWNLDAPTKARL
jgi:hypothetical protein